MSNSYEEPHIHHDVTWAEYQALSEEIRKSNEIYFITDVDSESNLIEKLIEELEKIKTLLEESKTKENE